jgi:hypothetical protein
LRFVKYSNDVKNVKCKHRFNAFFISGPFAPAYIIFGRGFAYKKLDNFRLSFPRPLCDIVWLIIIRPLSMGVFDVIPGSKNLV